MYSREKVAAAFENLMSEAAKSVLTQCYQPIPELRVYTGAWISRFRRLVVTCSKKLESNNDVAAVFLPSYQLRDYLEPEALAGIDAANSDTDSSEFDPVIAFPTSFEFRVIAEQEIMSDETSKDYTRFSARDIIHEVFHATPANNRKDHNAIERIKVNPKRFCEPDQESDRIIVMTDICSKDEISIRPGSLEYLSAKTDACPQSNACEKVFTSDIWFTNLQSKGLSRKNAAIVCKKLDELGRARTLRKLNRGVNLIGLPELNANRPSNCP
jgi:hypothetical protein